MAYEGSLHYNPEVTKGLIVDKYGVVLDLEGGTADISNVKAMVEENKANIETLISYAEIQCGRIYIDMTANTANGTYIKRTMEAPWLESFTTIYNMYIWYNDAQGSLNIRPLELIVTGDERFEGYYLRFANFYKNIAPTRDELYADMTFKGKLLEFKINRTTITLTYDGELVTTITHR